MFIQLGAADGAQSGQQDRLYRIQVRGSNDEGYCYLNSSYLYIVTFTSNNTRDQWLQVASATETPTYT